MSKTGKFSTLLGVSALSALVLSGCTGPKYHKPSTKTNHFQAQNGVFHGPNVNFRQLSNGQIVPVGRYGQPIPPQNFKKNKRSKGKYPYKNLSDRLRGKKKLAYQMPPPPPGPMGQFQRWVNYEPEYTLYPGDQLEVAVPSAPELSRTLTVGPDGRVIMPFMSPIMAAGRTIKTLEMNIMEGLATQLRDPKVAVTPQAFGPQQIFVGGQVTQQGTYALPGPIGALEAVLLAGGFQPSAKTKNIVVLRRAPDGGMMMRVVDIRNGLRNIREYNDNMQLRRGDIVFVPATTLAEVGNFVQQFRNTLPVDFNLTYQFGNQNGGTIVTQ